MLTLRSQENASYMRGTSSVRSENKKSAAGAVINLLLTFAPVWIFYFAYMRVYKNATFWGRGNYLFALIYTFMLILFMSVYSGYKVRQYRTRELVFSFALATGITNFITYFVMCLIARDMLPIWGVVFATIAQWFVGTGIYVLSRIILPMVEPAMPLLYIRQAGVEDRLSGMFDTRRSRYKVSGEISSALPWEDMRRAISSYKAVLIGDMDNETRRQIVSYCFRTGREALLLPDMTDVVLCSASPMIMGDALVYDLKTQGMDRTYRTLKRIIDVVASALGLVVLSPLMLGTAIAVKSQDGGPVFYRQERLTRGGKRFMLTKFRSMIVNAESGTGAVLAGKEDSRITKVGRFIRSTRIDELPQLWNILKGEMTLVGPRPERPEFYEIICQEYPEFDYRLKVKAGLTGYAQLYGKYNTTFAEKARLDMYYIQHASLLWDLQLLFYTLKIIFIKDSTEGVDAPAAPAAPEVPEATAEEETVHEL